MRKAFFYTVAAASFVGLIATGIHNSQVSAADTKTAEKSALKPNFAPPRDSAAASHINLPNFAEIVERVGPAVVHIAVEAKVNSRRAQSPFGNIDPNDPFFEFFKRFAPDQRQAPERKVQGMGSGFIATQDGYIYTNAHVVDGADKVTVKLTDQREFEGKVIGLDKATDVALLKIDAKNLPTVMIGDPSNVRVGEWVLAIGAPFGFENSVTAGIVSAKSRSLPSETYVPFLQTDVAINPGNSGGPLLNLSGEVIGVNSQIYSRSGGYQGLSFAIPIDVVNRVTQQLQTKGKVTRGFLGVGIQGLTQELAQSFNMKETKGALITSVEKGSAADKAGLEVSDIILSFNGKEVKDAAALPPLVGAVMPGESATVEIWRNGKTLSKKVVIGELSSEETTAEAAGEKSAETWGIAVKSLSDEEKERASVEKGVLITEVSESVDNGTVRPGDVILAVNGKEVESAKQFADLLKDRKESAALLIQRGNARLFVPIKKPK